MGLTGSQQMRVRCIPPHRKWGNHMATLTAIEITKDEREYDIWLATLTQASERLDVLQTVVNELRDLCNHENVVESHAVIEVLERHGAIA